MTPLRIAFKIGLLRLSTPAWIDTKPASRSSRRVGLGDVGLRLAEHPEAGARVAQAGEDLAEVAPVEDVVHHQDPRGVVPPGELEQLLRDALGPLAPERQRLIADAAERTVRARPPPAPARALVEQRHAGVEPAAAGDAASRVKYAS